MSSPSSAPTSPLPRQLPRNVPSSLGVALYRPAAPPAISLASVPRGVDAHATAAGPAAADGEERRRSSSERGARRAQARRRRESPRCAVGRDGASEGSGGKVHAAPVMAVAHVVVRGPASRGSPAEGAGGRGGSVHAAAS
ncbi:hypothetical protein SETIT_6G046900v2 [Setaria italica]|uniref:Uncharacterized protein n=1 Tax=Setaria italica TaxID=4555 RepID=K3YN16_SETIT|nr:hypothetical protein SETIT_6G046900v2 [Setaria italica]